MKSTDLYAIERWAFGEARKAYASQSPDLYFRYMLVVESLKSLREFDYEKKRGYTGGTHV